MSISGVLLPPPVPGQYCTKGHQRVKSDHTAQTWGHLPDPGLEDADGQGVASHTHGEEVYRISCLWKVTLIVFLVFLHAEPPVNMFLSSFLDAALDFKGMVKKAAGVCCLALAVTFPKAAEVWWSLLWSRLDRFAGLNPEISPGWDQNRLRVELFCCQLGHTVVSAHAALSASDCLVSVHLSRLAFTQNMYCHVGIKRLKTFSCFLIIARCQQDQIIENWEITRGNFENRKSRRWPFNDRKPAL